MSGFKKRVLSGYIAVLLTALTFGETNSAFAALDSNKELLLREPSVASDVGIAFLKMSDNFPDFAKLIQGTQEYQALDPISRDDYLTKTQKKYQSAFLGFSPKKSDLLLRMRVNTRFQKMDDGTGMLTINNFKSDPVYFPYIFADYQIALLVKDIEYFKTIHLSADEANTVYNRLALNGDATLILQLFPISASDKKPVMLDNINQYPMLSEIGYIGLFNARAEAIWSWKNEKYIGKNPLSLQSSGSGAAGGLVDMVPENKYLKPPQQ